MGGGPGQRTLGLQLSRIEVRRPEMVKQRTSRGARVGIGALVAAAVVLVGLSLRRPELPEFAPSPVLGPDAPMDSELLAGEERRLTVDASDPARWRHVDLERGSVVDSPDPETWDLAFRRFEVRVNGGAGQRGGGGVAELGEVPLDSVAAPPATDYVGMTASGRDTTHVLLEGWYSYSFTTHVLRPRPRTFAIRTTEGRHAAIEFVSYYCPGARPGCVTVRYRFLEAASGS